MTLPKISDECLLATLEKAAQQDPAIFAIDVMYELAENQPGTLACVQAITDLFTGQGEYETPEMEISQERTAVAILATLGIVLKALTATIEAADLDEQWS